MTPKEPGNQSSDGHSQSAPRGSGSDDSPEIDLSAEAAKAASAAEDSDEDKEDLLRRYLLRRFWHTARRYWIDPHSQVAWLLTGALFAVILLNLAASYAMNRWNCSIFDALEQKDADTVFSLSMIYFVILLVSVAFSVANVYARMTLQRRWRKWLTNILIDRWLRSGRYFQLNLVSGDHKNPEYRIADDVRIATELPVDFVTGIVSAFLSAATFIAVLWTLGGALDLEIAGFRIYVPGFLVIAAIVYALFASGAML